MEKIKNVKKYDVKTYQNRFFKKMKSLGKKRVGFWLTEDEEAAVKKLLENLKIQENNMTAQNDTYKTEAEALIAAIKEYKQNHQEREEEGFSANIYQNTETKKFKAEISFSADTRMTVWYENDDELVDELWENPDSKESLQELIEIAIIAEKEGYIIQIED